VYCRDDAGQYRLEVVTRNQLGDGALEFFEAGLRQPGS
jgi:hypothetical protein